jgi:hypothetical protein
MFSQLISLLLILSFPVIGISPEQMIKAIKSGEEKSMLVLANRLGFPDETIVPKDKYQKGMTAQNVVSIWQDNIALTENGKEVHAERKIVDVRDLGKGGRTDHILIFSDRYYLDRLVMIFSHRDKQWFYLGHVITNTRYADLICKTQTFNYSEDWILSLSWKTTGTGMMSEGITHYLVGSQGINKVTSYPLSGYDVASSSWPFAVMESKGDTLIIKDNDCIVFKDDVIVKYYLHNEDPNEKPPIIDLRHSVTRIYDLNKSKMFLSVEDIRFLGSNDYSVSLIDDTFLIRHFDKLKDIAKKMKRKKNITRFKLFLDYFPESDDIIEWMEL